MDTLQSIQAYVYTLQSISQFLAVFVIGAIPFIEGHKAALVGVAAGVVWPLTVAAGAAGISLVTVGAIRLGAKLGDHHGRGDRDRKVLSRTERIPLAMLIVDFLVSGIISALNNAMFVTRLLTSAVACITPSHTLFSR